MRLVKGRTGTEVAWHRTDTFRAVSTVRFHDAIYVLHAFQKKSTSGTATSRQACAWVASCVMRRLTSDPSIAAIAHRLAMIVRASAAFTIRVRR